jgi:hypothetical protein
MANFDMMTRVVTLATVTLAFADMANANSEIEQLAIDTWSIKPAVECASTNEPVDACFMNSFQSCVQNLFEKIESPDNPDSIGVACLRAQIVWFEEWETGRIEKFHYRTDDGDELADKSSVERLFKTGREHRNAVVAYLLDREARTGWTGVPTDEVGELVFLAYAFWLDWLMYGHLYTADIFSTLSDR